MRVPVLTYHAVNIAGNDYADNDHVAFAADLRMIDDLGLRIVPVQWVVERLLGLAEHNLDHCVALTCDDGSDFDYFDLVHPEHGEQRSLFNCLLDLRSERGPHAQPDLHLTAFVIASQEARDVMDRECLVDCGWMRDSWWRPAGASGLMSIENHSFDHNHPALREPGPDGMPRGSFLEVNNAARAEAEIAVAQQMLAAKLTPRHSTLFCYPFGHVPDYLHQQWLPENAERIGLMAAFGDGALPVEAGSDRWNLPRYICGWHWRSPEQLQALLMPPSD